MKGQASLEFMVVLTIFFAVLAIWLTAVNGATTKIDSAMALQQARLATAKIAAAINSACVMGSGNAVETEAYVPGKAEVTGDGALSLQWKNNTLEKAVHCRFQGFSVEGKETLVFENQNGLIKRTE